MAMQKLNDGIVVSKWKPVASEWKIFNEVPYRYGFFAGKRAETNFDSWGPCTWLESECGLWVSGMGNSSGQATQATIYRVEKPWGFEEWLNGERPTFYCFKHIFLKQGSRTSLQYHHKKHETNVLMSGKIRLHYSLIGSISNRKFRDQEIHTIDLEAPVSLEIFPFSIHRIEALSDVDLFETSTAEIDDVVRLSDDSSRSDGRISKEHTVGAGRF